MNNMYDILARLDTVTDRPLTEGAAAPVVKTDAGFAATAPKGQQLTTTIPKDRALTPTDVKIKEQGQAGEYPHRASPTFGHSHQMKPGYDPTFRSPIDSPASSEVEELEYLMSKGAMTGSEEMRLRSLYNKFGIRSQEDLAKIPQLRQQELERIEKSQAELQRRSAEANVASRDEMERQRAARMGVAPRPQSGVSNDAAFRAAYDRAGRSQPAVREDQDLEEQGVTPGFDSVYVMANPDSPYINEIEELEALLSGGGNVDSFRRQFLLKKYGINKPEDLQKLPAIKAQAMKDIRSQQQQRGKDLAARNAQAAKEHEAELALRQAYDRAGRPQPAVREDQELDEQATFQFSPEQETWLGKSDRQDPYILARMPGPKPPIDYFVNPEDRAIAQRLNFGQQNLNRIKGLVGTKPGDAEVFAAQPVASPQARPAATATDISTPAGFRAAYDKAAGQRSAAQTQTPPVVSTPSVPDKGPVATDKSLAPNERVVASGSTYRIQPGDTLTRIAAKNGTTVRAIMAANPQIQDANRIQAGAQLTLPAAPTTEAERISGLKKILEDIERPQQLDEVIPAVAAGVAGVARAAQLAKNFYTGARAGISGGPAASNVASGAANLGKAGDKGLAAGQALKGTAAKAGDMAKNVAKSPLTVAGVAGTAGYELGKGGLGLGASDAVAGEKSAATAGTSGAGNVAWQKIYDLNKAVIGDNPNLIKPGQQLKMPDGSTYTVQPGDSLWKIAQTKKITAESRHGRRPDFPDIDRDGDRNEPISKAAQEMDEASYSAKAARAGKDIGKPGKTFAKIAKSAGERYGSKERGEKVAGAVLAKLRAKEDVNEDDVEEGNDFTKARLDAIRAGKPTFKLNGKTYRVTGDTSDERRMDEGFADFFDKKQMYRKIGADVDGRSDDYVVTFRDGTRKRYQEIDGRRRVTSLEPVDAPEEQDDEGNVVKRGRGRPKGSKRSLGAKGPSGRSKLLRMEEDYDKDEYDEEGEMAKSQARTIEDAAQELQDILDDDENLPEWVQKKIVLAKEYIDSARDYMKANPDEEDMDVDIEVDDEELVAEKAVSKAQRAAAGIAYAAKKGDIPKSELRGASKEMADMPAKELKKFAKTKEKGLPEKVKEEDKEEVDETTVAGSVAVSTEAPKAKKGGMQFGKGVYESQIAESFDRKLAVLTEGMNINMSVDETGKKSLTVSATDKEADQLAAILKMAGLGSGSSGSTCEVCGGHEGMHEAGCAGRDMVEEELANSPDPEYAELGDTRDYGVSGGLNGPKLQSNPNNPADNPLAMRSLASKGASGQLNLGAVAEDIEQKMQNRLMDLYKRIQ